MSYTAYAIPRPRRPVQSSRFASGPWRGVRTTIDPLDDVPDLLYDASNLYSPDPGNASGFYQRPPFQLLNNGAAVTTDSAPFRGQGVFYHTDVATGVTYNFVVFDGKLFRSDATGTVFTDVSPVGITIDATGTSRVYGTNFGDQFVITDGVNKPWLASSLSSTPIVGTTIQFNAADDDWALFGPAVVYGGSVFGILDNVAGTAARGDIVWSIAGDASTGWQQTNYDFRWTVLQNIAPNTSPALYALVGLNTGLVYFREGSIGALSGTPGPDLQTTATHDLIAENIGTLAPQNIVQFGSYIYFTDQVGRPYRLAPGSEPEPIWLQMRSIVDDSTVAFTGINALVGTAAPETQFNLYICALFTTSSSLEGPPVEMYAWDMRTGTYFGRWSIADGVSIETLGTFIDANGRGQLIALGSLTAPVAGQLATSGYAWSLASLIAAGDFLTTAAGVFLTTADGVYLTTAGSGATGWEDNGITPSIYARSGRMGYDPDTVLNVGRATALVGSADVVTVSAETAAVAQTAQGTPTPSTVQDGVARIVCGFAGVQGRGVEVQVGPSSVTEQWSIQAMTVEAVVSKASPLDA